MRRRAASLGFTPPAPLRKGGHARRSFRRPSGRMSPLARALCSVLPISEKSPIRRSSRFLPRSRLFWNLLNLTQVAPFYGRYFPWRPLDPAQGVRGGDARAS